MFKLKKSLAFVISFLIFVQQFSFAAAAAVDAGEVALSAAAMARLEKFNNKTQSSWQIRMNRNTESPRALVNGTKLKPGKDEGAVLSFLNSNADFLGVDRKQLKLKLRRKSPIGEHFYFDQVYKGLNVENAYVKVNVNNKGELLNYQSTFIKDLNIDTNPSKSAQEAQAVAQADLGGAQTQGAELVIYSEAEGASAKLAWKVKAIAGDASKWNYFVDASTGAVLNKVSLLMHADTVKANLNPVYPGFGTLDTTEVPLSNLTVNYFTSANAAASAVTNAAGTVNVSRDTGSRLFFSFSGPYFSVADQRSSSDAYYIEKGVNGGGSQETIAPTKQSVSLGSSQNPASVTTYAACANAGDYPFLGSPRFTDFKVGKMNLYNGAITEKVFLNVASGGKVIGKYIGNNISFDGPLVPALSVSQAVAMFFSPSGRTGSYKVDTLNILCMPKAITSGYNQVSTHYPESNSRANANAFYNLNAMRDFFQTLNTGNYINLDNHLPVVINAFGQSYGTAQSGMLNAFYDVDENVLMFGQGEKESGGTNYRNFALESSIVRHEYVHAVVANIWPILYFGEGAAISEAVSDYFALSSITDGSGNPLTSQIGGFVALATASGEGAERNLNGNTVFDPLTWESHGAEGQHKNSLVLSQTLWAIRTNAATKANADKLVWTALMFFPDSLLEFRDAMISAANALSLTSAVSVIEAAFNDHGISYNNIITANGDIYEPNNGPDSAANIDIASIGKKELKASINPISDMDYFSVALPPGAFEAVLTLPQAPTASPVTYYPLAMVLLDAELKTVVDIVLPNMPGGQSNITTPDKTVTLKFEAPDRLNGNTGRYILGVFKPEAGAYPSPVTATTGAYTLNFKFSKGSNIGGINTVMDDFANGKQITFKAPFNTYSNVQSASAMPAGLSDWTPNRVEAFHSVRLLDRDFNPLSSAYISVPTAPVYNATDKVIEGTAEFAGNFAALGHNVVYIQVFAKLRANASAPTTGGTSYPEDYGVVSLGISDPIRNKVSSGEKTYIRNPIFNPDNGLPLKIEISAPENGNIKVQVFTLDGLLVKDLYDGEATTALPVFIEWDGRNSNGSVVASGVYLLRTHGAGIDKQLKKLVVVR